MKLKFIVGLSLAVVFCVSSIAFAQTMTAAQKQALIAQIQQQIAEIMQQIVQQQGGAWCYTFYNNLGYTNSGSNEVVNLHTALQKQGISYSPDGVNIYSSGTSQGIIQFQAKYGISPQSGYVGYKTRAELNQLYGCKITATTTTTTTTTCTPKWTCGSWGTCFTAQQSRTCTDSNNCGTATNEPATTQSCTVKPAVNITVGNSAGPVNIFLTLGNGASVSGTGIALSENIGLQWNGVEVSSCKASDSMNPQIFSGYIPYYGSQTVVLSGTIQNGSSSNNKVSDTFKINCISTAAGGSVSGSVTVNLYYTVNGNCSPFWQCSSWGTCVSSKQTRTCEDYSGCGSSAGEPATTQSCVLPTVDIKANSSNGPITVSSGSSVSLSWTSSGADSCTASGNWSGGETTTGTQPVTVTASPETFTLTCTSTGGSATDSVTVNTTGGT